MPASERPLSTADLAGAVPEQPDAAQHDEAGAHEQPVTEERLETAEPLDSEDRLDTAERSDGHPAEEVREPQEETAAPPLFGDDELTAFRGRWQEIQTGFVDDPRRAVRDADELVASVISALASTFSRHKGELEDEWRQGEPATEELRVALRRYRAFFDQLLPR